MNKRALAILGGLSLLLIAAAIYVSTHTFRVLLTPKAVSNYNPQTTNAPSAATASTTNRNSQFSFSIEYPANLQPDATRTGALSYTATTTNGTPGSLTFFVFDADSDVGSSCLLAPGPGETTTTDVATTTINGVSFLSYGEESTSAGHVDLAHFFKTTFGGRCIIIADGVSDTTDLAAEDASQIFKVFDPIISTLRLRV